MDGIVFAPPSSTDKTGTTIGFSLPIMPLISEMSLSVTRDSATLSPALASPFLAIS